MVQSIVVFKASIDSVPQTWLDACLLNEIELAQINKFNIQLNGESDNIQKVIDVISTTHVILHSFGLQQDSNVQLHTYQKINPNISSSHDIPYFATTYRFPESTASNQKIGIIELGGGYKLSDVQILLDKFNIPNKPKISDISILGASNNPDDSEINATKEVILDLQIIIVLVPEAQINMYFAPNSSNGFYTAILTAISDECNLISISWGASEEMWGTNELDAFDNLFKTSKSIICCASGDFGSSDGGDPMQQEVDFPSSSPHVIACGGTTIIGIDNGRPIEHVWNNNSETSATGGGLSEFFTIPLYQEVFVTYDLKQRRGVPDVSGNADPNTGYGVYAEQFGGDFIVGGTSAVSPLYTALFARLQHLTHNRTMTTLSPLLYANRIAFNDVLVGNNGHYVAQVGWDCCSGLGTPIGDVLLAVFSGNEVGSKTIITHVTPVWAIVVISLLSVMLIIAIIISIVFIVKNKSKTQMKV